MTNTPTILNREVPSLHEFSGDFDPILARVLAARGLGEKDCDFSLSRLPRPDLLKGMEDAVSLCMAHRGKFVVVVGDYDADGATATALLVSGLQALGWNQVDFLVPNRFREGYGLTPVLSEQVAAMGGELLITVDNGIASIEGVAHAKSLGLSVLVTDHHLPGEVLPKADAILNPNQPGCSFPAKSLAGVGVAFYLLLGLRAVLRDCGDSAGGVNLGQWLDLVALGTIADVVPMEEVNRLLVQQGLYRLRAGQARVGILALCEQGKCYLPWISSQDIAFSVAPRLNAAGRMEDMRFGIQCLLSTDMGQARLAASRLSAINAQRVCTEAAIQQQLLPLLSALKTLPKGLCFAPPESHEGVIGIVAGRLKERFHRPAIVFAPADSGMLKGSARSIPGLNIRDVLVKIASRLPTVLYKFGGHAMAAGLSIAQADFEVFHDAFLSVLEEELTQEALLPLHWVDGELPPSAFDLGLAKSLRLSMPWGQGLPPPQFQGEFQVLDTRVLKEVHLKCTLRPLDSDVVVEAIAFRVPEEWIASRHAKRLWACFSLDVNIYQGSFRLQLRLHQCRFFNHE